MNDTINRYLTILCYPFASLDFFLEDYMEEIIQERKRWGPWEKTKKRLQEAMVRHVQKTCSLYSYDEVYMYLEKCYLYDAETQPHQNALQLYLECFRKITRSLISQRDGKIVFKYWKNEHDPDFLSGFGDANKIFLFHSLNMHVPLDFLVMLHMVQNRKNNVNNLNHYYSQIEVADQQLDAVLQAGVAENHLHKGVSLSFFEIWEAFMAPLDSHTASVLERMQIRLSDQTRGECEVLFYVLSAAVVRIWTALALGERMPEEFKMRQESGGQESGTGSEEDLPNREVRKLVRRFISGRELERFYRQWWGNIDEKRARHEILLYFQKLWETLLLFLPEQTEEQTIVQKIFGINKGLYTSDENIFLFKGMQYLCKCSEELSAKAQISIQDEQTVRCILQYLRVKHSVFGRTVQKKTIRGLDYFQNEFYNRNSKMNQYYSAVSAGLVPGEERTTYWELAMRKQFQNRDLKKIEFRMSVNENEAGFRKEVQAFLEAYRRIIQRDYCKKTEGGYRVNRDFPQVGLVCHLIKETDRTVPDKCYLDGLKDREKMQFGMLEDKYERQVRCMQELRDGIPGLDRYLVGIDAASLENSTPVWGFVRAYEKARDSLLEPIGYGRNQRQSLRFTFHAGEDFRHMLSGLRRMDEAVTFLKFHAGDRIGHGTALGISPRLWKERNPFAVLPRIEALENYIWAYYELSQDTAGAHFAWTAYIERRVCELAEGIYGKSQGLTMQALTEGYLKTFAISSGNRTVCKEAEDTGFCEAVRNRTYNELVWNGEKIARARHCRKFLTEMERPIHYEVTEQDIQITETLQEILRRKLSRKGIVVEVNPSSNLAIGEIDRITENQIYRLNRPGGEDNVMVCINSDDPSVFHTNVSNELAYIYYGMLNQSVSRETVLQWIDNVRECGMKASFLQRTDSGQQIYEELEQILERL